MNRRVVFIKYSLLALFLMVICLTIVTYLIFKNSLPLLEGQYKAPGVQYRIEIERDAQGIPTIRGSNRRDIAYALGFLHAQERFFQMDLLRRSSAGELSELIGKATMRYDKDTRLHRFRDRASAVLQALSPQDQQILRAYAEGVNEGLNQLTSRPFEYWILGHTPKPWESVDSLLCVYAMYMDLQHTGGEYERSLAFMKDRLPQDWYEFLKPQAVKLNMAMVDHWEAPIDGHYNTELSLPKTPIVDFVDVFSVKKSAINYETEGLVGSNNWGVGGRLTKQGAAMVADDMHLGIRVPNIWYRASWFHPKKGNRITGATLPGTPVMIVGSNENIAWGYTNSYGDWNDVIRLTTNLEGDQYLTPNGWAHFIEQNQVIFVKDRPVEYTFRETIWGPIIGKDHSENLIALRWAAHDVEAVNINLMRMETAESVTDALAVMAQAGIPQQNLIVGDKDGKLAWSIAGPIPQRKDPDTQKINDWSSVSGNWTEYLGPDEYPVVFAGETARLWTANSRVLANNQYDLIGDGGYDIGIRAGSIRDQLFDRNNFVEKDLLDLQLSTHNRLLDEWKGLLITSVDTLEHTIKENIMGAMADWQGRADPSSVGYPLVKAFRRQVLQNTLGPIYETLALEEYDGFDLKYVDNHIDNPLWMLVQTQPDHALNPAYASWSQLFSSSAMEAYDNLIRQGKGALPTWGELNQIKVQHPLGRAIPLLSWLTDMPSHRMPGDRKNVVRVQSAKFGASQRMVVSPGHESSGIFHMATGQSGNPISPFYGNGHEDWVEGNPSSFLPGETKYTLSILPQ